MLTTLTLTILLLAADPVPPSIEEQLAKLADTKKQREELQKAETDLAKLIRARLLELQKKADELTGPVAPPAPTPVPPTPPAPADPLTTRLRAAYLADGASSAHGEQLADLAEVYRQAAKLAADADKAPTAAALKTQVRAAAAGLAADLVKLRQAVSAEVTGVLPAGDALSAADRARLVDEFTRLAAALVAAGH